jgi:hypothetical protein
MPTSRPGPTRRACCAGHRRTSATTRPAQAVTRRPPSTAPNSCPTGPCGPGPWPVSATPPPRPAGPRSPHSSRRCCGRRSAGWSPCRSRSPGCSRTSCRRWASAAGSPRSATSPSQASGCRTAAAPRRCAAAATSTGTPHRTRRRGSPGPVGRLPPRRVAAAPPAGLAGPVAPRYRHRRRRHRRRRTHRRPDTGPGQPVLPDGLVRPVRRHPTGRPAARAAGLHPHLSHHSDDTAARRTWRTTGARQPGR